MYDDDDGSSLVSMTDFLEGPRIGPSTGRPESSAGRTIRPTTGPDYYELRRAQWIQPTRLSVNGERKNAKTSKSHAKLEAVLDQAEVEEDDAVWTHYLSGIHDSLVGGKRLKKGMKLHLAVKILKAGWLRDGTWETAVAASAVKLPLGPFMHRSVTPDLTDTPSMYSPLQRPRKLPRGIRSLLNHTVSPSHPQPSSPIPLTSTTFAGENQPLTNKSPGRTSPSGGSLLRVSFGFGNLRRMLKGNGHSHDEVDEVANIVQMMKEAPLLSPMPNRTRRFSLL